MHTSVIMAVNSPPVGHRNPASASYRPYYDDYAVVQKARPEKPEETERIKKDKKWSIGKLFRRKKKDGNSSSSESEESSTRSLKKKSKKKKKVTAVSNFDHIVLRDNRRAQSVVKQKTREFHDEGVLSDPSAGFTYKSKLQQEFTANDHLNGDLSRSGGISSDVMSRRTRKGRLKARVEALRNSMRGDSSSDEGSLKSSNSSSIVRFRSDDSLMRSRDSSLNKKSRSARNERYIKRLSRDDENQLNKEAELLQQGYTKAEVEMFTRTPTSQSSGYGTCKRDYQMPTKVRNEQAIDNRRPIKSESISSFPSTHSYPSSINFNAKVNNDHINYSIQHPVKKHTDPVYINNRDERNNDHYLNSDNVMCVKLPLGNMTNIKREDRVPPAPPPRDMQRKVSTPLSMYYDNIVADRTALANRTHGVQNNDYNRVMRRSQERSLHPAINNLRRPFSTSEDHIAIQNNEYLQDYVYKSEQPKRPASVSAEPQHYGMYTSTPPWRRKVENTNIIKPEPVQMKPDYLYYADQSPRSRRPISIKTSQKNPESHYLSDSQTSLRVSDEYRKPNNASEFWKKMDDVERQRRQENSYINNAKNDNKYFFQRPKAFIENNKFNQSSENSDVLNRNKLTLHAYPRESHAAQIRKPTTEYKTSVSMDQQKPVTSPSTKSHIRHKSDTFLPNSYQMPSDDEKNSERRKSTNLDDALNELEAIYNSLGLGDEDLLDRAERREIMAPKNKNNYNDWNGNDELQLRSQPSTPFRRLQRRSTLPDKLQDDMAFRKLNPKDKQSNKDLQSQISYMLASPVFIPNSSDDDRHSEYGRDEPDIVHDDVVYRNIRQASRLKTLDPQPPFGIPLGPVSPAPQSDYLHATPENRSRPRFIPRRSPDIVSDDLAYRSLRKDRDRRSSFFNGDEFNGHINNNHNNQSEYLHTQDLITNKKKRAVRSLSANIFTMIQKEIDDALCMNKSTPLQKTNSNNDVNRRLRDTCDRNDNAQDYYPRNKVKQRHNTVNLYSNSTHLPIHHLARDDSYIHNDDKYLSKPSSCDKSKSSSPSNRSPQPSKRSSKDEFQHVLTMLAQEAMDTSNKLGVALAELDKNRNSNSERKSEIQTKISDSRLNFLNTLTNKNLNDYNTSELKHVKVHSELVNESCPKPFLVPTENIKARKTEDSLLAISDQLHKVEDKLKHSFEKEINFEDESVSLSDYVCKADEKTKAQETTVLSPDSKVAPDIIPIVVQNDIVHVTNNEKSMNDSGNTFQQSSTDYNEIQGLTAFNELKEGISDLIAGITQVNDKVFTPNRQNKSEEGKITGITEAEQKLNEASSSYKLPTNRASVNLSIYEDDLEIKKDNVDSTEYNSSEELATIFHFDKPASKSVVGKEKTQRNDLSSPKLVQNMNQQLRKTSDECYPNQSAQVNVVPWRLKRHNSSQSENKGARSSLWHDSPGTLIACYTLVGSQQLAQLDWLTLLGLLLAVITIIAMLLI